MKCMKMGCLFYNMYCCYIFTFQMVIVLMHNDASLKEMHFHESILNITINTNKENSYHFM